MILTNGWEGYIIKVNFRKGGWFIMCDRTMFLAIAAAPINVIPRCIVRSVIISHPSFED